MISFQEKKIKVLNIRSKKELFKENVQLKKQLKMQEALLKANATQVQTMIKHLKDMKLFVDEHVEFMSKLPKRSRKQAADYIVKHDEHWKLKGRDALE